MLGWAVYLQLLGKGDKDFSSRDDKSFAYYVLFILLLIFPNENSNNKFRLPITKEVGRCDCVPLAAGLLGEELQSSADKER